MKLLQEYYCPDMPKNVRLQLQEKLYEAIMAKEPPEAVRIMRCMFDHRKPL